ncbi:MAG: CPBP family glutamic-type intramembrane protease [Planctomycetota bacterium]|jgi:membrane protease YdiL (CAAX protease family)
MKSLGKIGDLIVVILAATFVPRLISVLAKQVYPFVSSLDPDNVFLYQSIRHILMLFLPMILMKLWLSRRLRDYGFNLKDWRRSLRIFFWFCLLYLIPVFFVNVLPHLISGRPPSFRYPLNARNIAGRLSYMYLLTGTGEEPLFRGFAIVVLSQSWKRVFRIWRIEISSAGLIATVLFMIAHIRFTVVPFEITFISWMQQLWALWLGLYYAIVFQKTKSLLCPVLSHGYSNGTIFTLRYFMAYFL